MAGSGKRRFWFIGASVVAVAGVSWMTLSGGDDDSADLATGGDGYLVAGDLPDDWDVMLAATPATLTELAAADPYPDLAQAGEVVAYGDSSLDDPWEGPVLAVRHYDEGSPPGPQTSVPFDEMTVGGEPFTVSEDEADDSVLFARADDDDLLVVGYGMARDDVLASLEHLEAGPEIGSDGLPDGYEEIARGPLSATEPTPEAPSASDDGLLLGYWRQSLYAPSPDITLTQLPAGDSEAVGLIRLWALEDTRTETTAELAEVRGNEAHVLRQVEPDASDNEEDGFQALQWFEPSVGQTVTMTATEVDQTVVDAFIAGVRTGGTTEVDELLARGYPALEPEPDCGPRSAEGGTVFPESDTEGPPPTIQPPTDGSVVVAEDQRRDMAWQLTFLDEGEDCGRLQLETADASGSVRTPVDLEGSLTEAKTLVTAPSAGEDPEVGIYGLVAPGIAAVSVEHSDGEAYDLELFSLDSAKAQAFVGFVPSETTAYELVARDEAGEVVDEWVEESSASVAAGAVEAADPP